jgi:hypothetical protein
MTSLIDIAKRRVSVNIQGLDIPVFGISAEGLVYLVERFPVFQALLFPQAAAQEARVAASPVGGQRKQPSRAVEASQPASDTLSLMQSFPKALPAILAAGTGHWGDADHEAAAATLGASDQLELLDKIMALTMPKGLADFLERLTVLMAGSVGRQPPRNESEPTSLPSGPNGRASDIPSQSVSGG